MIASPVKAKSPSTDPMVCFVNIVREKFGIGNTPTIITPPVCMSLQRHENRDTDCSCNMFVYTSHRPSHGPAVKVHSPLSPLKAVVTVGGAYVEAAKVVNWYIAEWKVACSANQMKFMLDGTNSLTRWTVDSQKGGKRIHKTCGRRLQVVDMHTIKARYLLPVNCSEGEADEKFKSRYRETDKQAMCKLHDWLVREWKARNTHFQHDMCSDAQTCSLDYSASMKRMKLEH